MKKLKHILLALVIALATSTALYFIARLLPKVELAYVDTLAPVVASIVIIAFDKNSSFKKTAVVSVIFPIVFILVSVLLPFP
jgi:hypothetical protein